MIFSRFWTRTVSTSLNLTVFSGFVKISAKLNFDGLYLSMILSFLDRTSPQNLTLISICFVLPEYMCFFQIMCEAGSLSPNRTVDCSIHVIPISITWGCNHKTFFYLLWNVTYPLCFSCQFDCWWNLHQKKAKRLGIASPPKINPKFLIPMRYFKTLFAIKKWEGLEFSSCCVKMEMAKPISILVQTKIYKSPNYTSICPFKICFLLS